MKPRIAFITGGFSGEAEVSYASARTIEKNIDPLKFDFYKIDIRPEGWFYTDKNGKKTEVDKNDFSIAGEGGKIHFDAALIGIHGTPGEDGKLQGYLELLKIPYTTCDAAVSALTFNKRYAVSVAAFSKINVSRSVLFFCDDADMQEKIEEVEKFHFPVFVKPNNGGSSIGMSKVYDAGKLNEALEKAFLEDNQVLVEEGISGREFSIGVYKSGGKINPLPVAEIISQKDFFDYEAKYKGASREIIPAAIPDELRDRVQHEASKIYKVFNCRGVIRIDFIYNKEEDKIYMLEINTVPGQTEASIVPQEIFAAGSNLMDFYTGLIEECLQHKF